MAKFFQQTKLLNSDGTEFNANELEGKIVGLYFSAHWCPPCRGFTPQLVEKYNELVEAGLPFEIVFISSDRNEEDCAHYFSEMPWKLLAFGESAKKNSLSDPSEGFGIRGIPTLVLLDEHGQLITKEGRSVVMSIPFDNWKTYEADRVEKERKLADAITNLPDSITHTCHQHSLVKTDGRNYGCDVCHGGGHGWSFYCSDCDFDAHPSCVFPELK